MKVLLLSLLLMAGLVHAEPKGKYVILLHAGNETNEGAARAAHALVYAQEMSENGFDVVLIFDGAASGWAQEFAKPEHPMYKRYEQVRKSGVVMEICDYCSEHFHVQEKLSEQQKALLSGDYEGHPSLVKWIGRGYRVISL